MISMRQVLVNAFLYAALINAIIVLVNFTGALKKEAEQWSTFSVEHNCREIERGKNSYLCDDGVIYVR